MIFKVLIMITSAFLVVFASPSNKMQAQIFCSRKMIFCEFQCTKDIRSKIWFILLGGRGWRSFSLCTLWVFSCFTPFCLNFIFIVVLLLIILFLFSIFPVVIIILRFLIIIELFFFFFLFFLFLWSWFLWSLIFWRFRCSCCYWFLSIFSSGWLLGWRSATNIARSWLRNTLVHDTITGWRDRLVQSDFRCGRIVSCWKLRLLLLDSPRL